MEVPKTSMAAGAWQSGVYTRMHKHLKCVHVSSHSTGRTGAQRWLSSEESLEVPCSSEQTHLCMGSHLCTSTHTISSRHAKELENSLSLNTCK